MTQKTLTFITKHTLTRDAGGRPQDTTVHENNGSYSLQLLPQVIGSSLTRLVGKSKKKKKKHEAALYRLSSTLIE